MKLNLQALIKSEGEGSYIVMAKDVSDTGIEYPDDCPYQITGVIMTDDGQIAAEFPPFLRYAESFMDAQYAFAEMVAIAARSFGIDPTLMFGEDDDNGID